MVYIWLSANTKNLFVLSSETFKQTWVCPIGQFGCLLHKVMVLNPSPPYLYFPFVKNEGPTYQRYRQHKNYATAQGVWSHDFTHTKDEIYHHAKAYNALANTYTSSLFHFNRLTLNVSNFFNGSSVSHERPKEQVSICYRNYWLRNKIFEPHAHVHTQTHIIYKWVESWTFNIDEATICTSLMTRTFNETQDIKTRIRSLVGWVQPPHCPSK